jgi:hypothetical protein
MMPLRTTRLVIALAVGLAALSPPSLAETSAQTSPGSPADGKHDLTISGCLLRSGYAGYQIEDAQVDAIDGKPFASPTESGVSAAKVSAPKKWILEGAGNLGGRTGEKVQVVGRSDWQPRPPGAPEDDPPNRTPRLEVKSVKTIAAGCQ